MDIRGSILRLSRDHWRHIAAGAAVVVVAVVLYARFSINGDLSRDESIYVYSGQQFAHGVPPYASVFDPKTPLPSILAGVAAWFADLIGRDDVHLIRLAYFVCAVLTVLAVYLLVVRLFRSITGGVAAAVVMASYTGFARDALAGPDAKTPGVLAVVLCMWFAARRNFFWAGVCASIGFLVWQPWLIFPIMSLVAAAAMTPRAERLRQVGVAAAGVATPLVLTIGYFTAAGALGKFVESTLDYPLTGVRRPNTSPHGFLHVAHVLQHDYGFSGVLFWIGDGLLLALAIAILVRPGRRRWRNSLTDPVLVVVLLTGVFEFGYALIDFQSYPDAYPLLPYPAIGIGAAVALATRYAATPSIQYVVVGATLVVALLLTVFSAVWFGEDKANNTQYRDQRIAGCALVTALSPRGSFWSLGSPVPLVVSHRRNPDRYIYLDAGVDAWKVHHTPGGFDGWTQQIESADPQIVALSNWDGPYTSRMTQWLRSQGYHRWFIGRLRLFMTRSAVQLAVGDGIRPTRQHTDLPVTTAGPSFRRQYCENG